MGAAWSDVGRSSYQVGDDETLGASVAASSMDELAERTLQAARIEKDAAARGEHVHAFPTTEVAELERRVILELYKKCSYQDSFHRDIRKNNIAFVPATNTNCNLSQDPNCAGSQPPDTTLSVVSDDKRGSTAAHQKQPKRTRRPALRKENVASALDVLEASLTLSSHNLQVLLASLKMKQKFSEHSEVRELSRHTAACFVRAAKVGRKEMATTSCGYNSPASVHFLVHHDPSLSRLTKTSSIRSHHGSLSDTGVLLCVRVILQESKNVRGSSIAANSSIFKVICECDPLAHVRASSSPCVHARIISEKLWSNFTPSVAGRDVRSILRTLERACQLDPGIEYVLQRGGDNFESYGFTTASVIRERATSDRSVQAIAVCFGERGRNGQSVVAVTCSATKECGKAFRNIHIRCSICRSDTSSRGSCSHQVAATDAFSELLLTYADDNESSNSGSENGDVDSGRHLNEDKALPLRQSMCQRYVSKRGRSPLSCWSDILCIRRRLDSISQGSDVHLRDVTGVCVFCDFDEVLAENCFESPRTCTLETTRGQVRCFVYDWRCTGCARLNYFDGLEEAVVVGSRDHVYCRSVLDYLMEEIFADGKTFHGAHASFSRSLRLLGESGSRAVGCARRRRMSDGFSRLISLVGDAPGAPGSISRVLRCTTGCADEFGNPKCLVIDGTTAAAHKNPLNSYRRGTVLVKAMPSSKAKEQFALMHESEREAVRYLCIFGISALKSGGAFFDDERVDISRSLGKASTTSKVKRSRLEALKSLVRYTGSASDLDLPLSQILQSPKRNGRLAASNALKAVLQFYFNDEEDSFSSDGEGSFSNGECQANTLSVRLAMDVGSAENNSANITPLPPVVADPDEETMSVHSHVRSHTRGEVRVRIQNRQLLSWSFELFFTLLCDPLAVFFLCPGGDQWASHAFYGMGNALIVIGQATAENALSISIQNLCDDTQRFAKMHNCAAVTGFAAAVSAVLDTSWNPSEIAEAQKLSRIFGELILACTAKFKRFYSKFISPGISRGNEPLKKEQEILRAPLLPVGDNAAISTPRKNSACAFRRAEVTGHFYDNSGLCVDELTFTGKMNLCVKNYLNPHGSTPGIVMVCCLCPIAIIYGASALEFKESLGGIWSIIVIFFSTATHIVYDNACNLFYSVLLRLPLTLRGRRIVVDSFHKGKGHTCGPSFDKRTEESLDGARLSVGESLNRRMKEVSNSIMYVRPEHFILYVGLRIVFYNLKAKWRKKFGEAHAEEANLHGILNELCTCKCLRCNRSREMLCGTFARFEREENSRKLGVPTMHVTRFARSLWEQRSRKRSRKAMEDICSSWKY